MDSQVLNPRGLRERADLPEPAVQCVGTDLVPPAQGKTVRRACPSVSLPARQEFLPEEALPTLAEVWEILVADPRGSQTPAQRVDERLLALLPPGRPGSIRQAARSGQGTRRIPGGASPAARRLH